MGVFSFVAHWLWVPLALALAVSLFFLLRGWRRQWLQAQANKLEYLRLKAEAAASAGASAVSEGSVIVVNTGSGSVGLGETMQRDARRSGLLLPDSFRAGLHRGRGAVPVIEPAGELVEAELVDDA